MTTTAAAGETSEFGPIERLPMSKLQGLVSAHMVRSWTSIPHVTQHDDADISALEAFRAGRAKTERPSLLAFLVKASVIALRAHPRFNASLDPDGANLVLKKYFHIGIAVDTPRALLVPVIRNADAKSALEISEEIAAVSELARTKGLPLDRMSGGCFTISSLGGIGGTGFTPIINAPEAAILGVSRSWRKACEVDGQLAWRQALPLSLSYDHRIINGADAARFCRTLADALEKPQGLLA